MCLSTRFFLMNQSIHQSINPSIHQSINPSIQSINPSIHQSINQINQSICPSIQLTCREGFAICFVSPAVSASTRPRARSPLSLAPPSGLSWWWVWCFWRESVMSVLYYCFSTLKYQIGNTSSVLNSFSGRYFLTWTLT
jgi:hypothetical protein